MLSMFCAFSHLSEECRKKRVNSCQIEHVVEQPTEATLHPTRRGRIETAPVHASLYRFRFSATAIKEWKHCELYFSTLLASIFVLCSPIVNSDSSEWALISDLYAELFGQGVSKVSKLPPIIASTMPYRLLPISFYWSLLHVCIRYISERSNCEGAMYASVPVRTSTVW